jgi:hypothetical protein
VTYPPYLREKARQLRSEKDLTIDEIAERLAVGRTTVFYWVGDMPRPARCKARTGPPRFFGTKAMQAKYKRVREEARVLGEWEFPRLARDPVFRDFVCLYIAEGYKRNRNRVSVANSDPTVIMVAAQIIRCFSTRELDCSVQFHADQNLAEIRRFWAGELDVEPESIKLQRKSNSSQLKFRKWRSRHGVISIGVNDTALRARLQGWINSLKKQWLDSRPFGV